MAQGTLTWACCLDKGGSNPATFTLDDPVAWRDQLVFDKVIVAVHAKGDQPYTETLPEMAPPVTVPATTQAPAAVTPATTAAPSVGYGYLSASESEVSFLQFTKGPGGELTGSSVRRLVVRFTSQRVRAERHHQYQRLACREPADAQFGR